MRVFVSFLTTSCILLLLMYDSFWTAKYYLPNSSYSEAYSAPYLDFPSIRSLQLAITDSNKLEVNYVQVLDNKDFAYNTKCDTYELNKEQTKLYVDIDLKDVLIDSVTIKKISDGKFQIFQTTLPITISHEKKAKVNVPILLRNELPVSQAIDVFNQKRIGKTGDCGYFSRMFKSICDSLNITCRIIRLEAGRENKKDHSIKHFDDSLSLTFPSHIVCEIYNFNTEKWECYDPYFSIYLTITETNITAYEAQSLAYFNHVNLLEINHFDSAIKYTSVLDKVEYCTYYHNIYIDRDYSNTLYHLTRVYLLPLFDKAIFRYKYFLSPDFSNNKLVMLYVFGKACLFILLFFFLPIFLKDLGQLIYQAYQKN